MPDINKPASQDKNMQRVSENFVDKVKLIEDAFFDCQTIKFLNDGQPSLVAAMHSHQLLDEASSALRNNDIQEAAHQLRREVDFCNALPKMAGSPDETSGRAGLEALKQNKSAAEIDRALEEAWTKAWKENPAPFYQIDNLKI